MATHALSIGTPAAATPHLALAALTAPACWTADPRAVKLLASCAALPPVIHEHRSRFGNAVDRWTAFAGYRVEGSGYRLLQRSIAKIALAHVSAAQPTMNPSDQL